MKTLSDVIALLDKMHTIPGLESHAQSLEGPRMRGSTTKIGLREMPNHNIYPCDSINVQPGCRAFYFNIPESAEPRVGAITLEQALEGSFPKKVKIRQGKHGPELYIDQPPSDAVMQSRMFGTVILGQHEGQEVIFTWHPGNPLPAFDGVTLDRMTAVKVHNGE